MRPWDIERDEDGLPVVPESEERVARIVAWIATLFFTLAVAWEIDSPFVGGHFATPASLGIIADNMWKWRILGPVWEYTAAPPGNEQYYCHHPWGIFWVTALLFKVLGRHDYVCRLAPVLLSAATPPILYGLCRSVWRPAAGAAAALAFVVLPLSLAYGQFNALEVPVMTWTLLGLFGYVRFLQTHRRGHGALAVLGMTLAMHSDWQAFVLVVELLAFALMRQYLLPRRVFGHVHERRYAALWIALACSALLSGGLYLVAFHRLGKLNDLLHAGTFRAHGSELPLSAVLASRRYWIELCFTPLAVALGKLAAVVCAARLVLVRREAEAVPLLYLGMAVFQYVIFKQGADVHVFWPHTFAGYFALAAGALVATLSHALEALWRRYPQLVLGSLSRAPLAALTLVALPLAVVLRDGLPVLVYARGTGGMFSNRGALVDAQGGAPAAFMRWIAERTPLDQKLDLHEGMKPTWGMVWTLGGRIIRAGVPPARAVAEPGPVPYLADVRFLADETQAELAAKLHPIAVGPFWYVDRASGSAPIDAFSIRESEPTLLQRYFVSGTEPVRTIVADPLATWELRTHFGQPAPAVEKAPETLEERRILHNMAVAAGDAARARALLSEIEAALSPPRVRFDDGSELLGVRFTEGVCPTLLLVLRAAGPTAKDVQLTVKSKVVARAPLSTTMLDPVEREVGLPLPIAPERWKAGYVYADAVPIRKRPGREVLTASFLARRRGAFPKPADGRKSVEVLALP